MFSSCWRSCSEMSPRGPGCLLILLVMACAGCAHLPGVPLEPGQRVRVQIREAEPARRTGTVIALTADSLALAVDSGADGRGEGPRLAYPVAAIKRVEISTGVHPQTLDGMVYGSQAGLIVVLLGTVAGKWLAGDEESIGVFAACTVAGGVIGTCVRKEDWRRLPLSCVRVSVGPLPEGGLGVGASVVLRR